MFWSVWQWIKFAGSVLWMILRYYLAFAGAWMWCGLWWSRAWELGAIQIAVIAYRLYKEFPADWQKHRPHWPITVRPSTAPLSILVAESAR